MRVRLLSSIAALIFISAAGLARQSATQPTDDFQVVEVATGVYAAIAAPGGIATGNAGFIVGDAGVLVVDTFFTPQAAEGLIRAIEERTKQPIKYAINTHYHLDHSGGNQVFLSRNVPIIAHENVRPWAVTKNRRFLPAADELKKRRDDTAKQLEGLQDAQRRPQLERLLRRLDAMAAINLTPPSLTYKSGTVRLYLGTREVILFTLPGHTGGDTLVFVPDADVVFMGDMGWSKTLPNLVDATVEHWIPSLDKVLAGHGKAKFVPGHGSVAGAAEMTEFRDYLDDLRTRVKQAIAGGLTIEQAKEQLKLPEKYKGFGFQNFVQPNIEDMYKELKGIKEMR